MADWDEVLDALRLALEGGDAPAIRAGLEDCWDATAPTDAAQRCVLAHYLADVQPDVADEVAWDERALEAYTRVGDTDLMPVGVASAAGFAPSLHLNLGDGYRRLGRLDEARAQLEAGTAAADTLSDDGYGAMIRAGLDRLAARLDGTSR
ncbi:hypothetical protein [Mobilicoccus massiliensis]|uniref:hypothetical protein n=1 Tax=Mobilicoccus massiliensis TaxID=1522310 RepID=UPI000694E85F|nr:hypothetical protein [Mobilicoccus massiliensis]